MTWEREELVQWVAEVAKYLERCSLPFQETGALEVRMKAGQGVRRGGRPV